MMTPGTEGEVSPESMGKTASSAVGGPPDAKPGPSRTTGNSADQYRPKSLKRGGRPVYTGVGIGESNGNSG
jgi:hypothetical protein